MVFHQHRFDLVAVVQAEQPLRGLAVVRALDHHGLDAVEPEFLGREGSAQFLRQRRDRVEIVDELFGRGTVELIDPVIFQTVRRGERRAVLVAGAARFLVDPEVSRAEHDGPF